MAAIQYLTVQDVLWINLQVTGHPQEFNYATLEEATFYQYGYGESSSVLPQAAKFLVGFLKKKPLAAGNEATAFVSCLSFLKANGFDMPLANPIEWFRAIESGNHEALPQIEKSAHAFHHEDHEHHASHAEVRDAIASVLALHKPTIEQLGSIPA